MIEEVEGGRNTKKSFRSMPSVVFFKPNGESWVGRQANMMTSLYPSRALFDTKHLVGTVYDSSKVQTSLYPKIVRGLKERHGWRRNSAYSLRLRYKHSS